MVIKMHKTQYAIFCDHCQDYVGDVLFEYVDIPMSSLREVRIACQECNGTLLAGV